MTLKILVADDSVTIQKIVALAFGCEDAVVESASTGDAAVDAAKSFKPDIVLADVVMPGGNGYDVCARLKADPELSHVPVVLMVGAFELFDEPEALRVQSDGRLTKPFDTEELIQTVRSLAGDKMDQGTSEAAVEPVPQEDRKSDSTAVGTARENAQGARCMVSERVWKSFLGPERVLDLLGSITPPAADASLDALAASPVIPGAAKTGPGSMIADEILNAIADRVVRRMSAEAIREVAWEVVPELSEVIIRRTLEERGKP
jgi:CheY-like chemotaxis protein